MLQWLYQWIPNKWCVTFQHLSLEDIGMIGRSVYSVSLLLESIPVVSKANATCGRCVAFRRLNVDPSSDFLLMSCREELLRSALTLIPMIKINVLVVVVLNTCFQGVLVSVLTLALPLSFMVHRSKVLESSWNRQKCEL